MIYCLQLEVAEEILCFIFSTSVIIKEKGFRLTTCHFNDNPFLFCMKCLIFSVVIYHYEVSCSVIVVLIIASFVLLQGKNGKIFYYQKRMKLSPGQNSSFQIQFVEVIGHCYLAPISQGEQIAAHEFT